MVDLLSSIATMMDGLGDPVIAIDAAGRVVHTNPRAAGLTGPGAYITELLQPCEQPGQVQHGPMPALAVLEACGRGAVRLVLAPGLTGAADTAGTTVATRPVDVCGAPIHDGAGALLGAILVLRDAPPIRDFATKGKATGALGDAGKMLQLVMDNIPQFIFWKDTRSVYLGCNKNFARAAGVGSPEDIVGKTDHDLPWKKEEADAFRACDRRVMDTSTPEYHIQEPVLQANGKQAWVDTNKIPLREEDGTVVGILGTFEDLTERLQLEAQLRHAQRMDAVGRLAGGVAHDFNNLLMAISGYAELALHAAPAQGPSRASLQQVLQASGRAAALTQQLLTFSRKQTVQPRIMDVSRLIGDLSGMLRRLIREDTEIVTVLAATGRVHADPGEIEQVIMNLAVNGGQAMPDGGKLTIETADTVLEHTGKPDDIAPGAYVCIRVADTGVGMDEEIERRIFEPFFTTKEPGKGTGLGLSLVQGMVTRAGGHIRVDSEPGRGTRFEILLPRVEGAEDETRAREIPAAVTRPRGSETILIVEDETAVRGLIARTLSDLGYTVIETTQGEEALRVTGAGMRIDLVLADVVMPMMGGVELVDRLRACHPGLCAILTSGYTGAAGLERYLAFHCAFLQKPFTMDVLAHQVRALLDSRGDTRGRPREGGR